MMLKRGCAGRLATWWCYRADPDRLSRSPQPPLRYARGSSTSLIAQSDVVKASDEDIDWLYQATPEDVAARWLALGPALVLITRGPHGVFAAIGAETAQFPTQPVHVVDTVGAGDSFMSGLLSGLLDAGLLGGPEGRTRLAAATLADIVPAIDRALACAHITVSRAGANPPRRNELHP